MTARTRLVSLTLVGVCSSALVFGQDTGAARRGDGRRAAQVPGRTTSREGTSRIKGRLFAADTSQPVRFAEVRVSSRALGISRQVTTDTAGLFDISGLPEGSYSVSASKGGFVALAYGQRRPFEPGTAVELAAGDTRELEFALPRGSVITGRITDDAGDPVPHAVVSAARYVYEAGGRRRLDSADVDDTTDDRGQFRLFGLMPGDYVVSASGAQASRGRARGEAESRSGYAPTYYPGVPSAGDAAVVSVGLGQEANANFGLVAIRLARVSGTVSDSNGRPASAASVTLIGGLSADDGTAMNTQARADGAFVLPGVPPGSYQLVVRRDGGGASGAAEMATMAVSVPPETDVTGLAVSTTRGATLSGLVTFQSDGTTTRRNVSVVATPVDQRVGSVNLGGVADGAVAADGRFRLGGLSGDVTLDLAGPDAALWAITSVSIDGRESTDRPTTVDAGRVLTARVALTDRLTDVAGAVTNARGQARSEFVVVLLPAGLPDGVLPTRYVRTARASGAGRFRVQGLPPGSYIAVALESLEEGREWEPAFQTWARERGTPVRVDAGRQTVVDLSF